MTERALTGLPKALDDPFEVEVLVVVVAGEDRHVAGTKVDHGNSSWSAATPPAFPPTPPCLASNCLQQDASGTAEEELVYRRIGSREDEASSALLRGRDTTSSTARLFPRSRVASSWNYSL